MSRLFQRPHSEQLVDGAIFDDQASQSEFVWQFRPRSGGNDSVAGNDQRLADPILSPLGGWQFLPGEGSREMECAASIEFALHPDAASEQLDKLLGDRQTQ